MDLLSIRSQLYTLVRTTFDLFNLLTADEKLLEETKKSLDRILEVVNSKTADVKVPKETDSAPNYTRMKKKREKEKEREKEREREETPVNDTEETNPDAKQDVV